MTIFAAGEDANGNVIFNPGAPLDLINSFPGAILDPQTGDIYPSLSAQAPNANPPTPWDQFNLGNNGQNIGIGTHAGAVDSAASSVLKPIGSAVSAVTGTIGFFSQPGRWGSVIVGILLIAGGLYLLGRTGANVIVEGLINEQEGQLHRRERRKKLVSNNAKLHSKIPAEAPKLIEAT